MHEGNLLHTIPKHVSHARFINIAGAINLDEGACNASNKTNMQLFPAQALLARKRFPKASKETKERRTQMQQTNILAQRSSLQPQQLAHLYSRVGIFAWLLVEQTPKSALSSTRQLGFASIFGRGVE